MQLSALSARFEPVIAAWHPVSHLFSQGGSEAILVVRVEVLGKGHECELKIAKGRRLLLELQDVLAIALELVGLEPGNLVLDCNEVTVLRIDDKEVQPVAYLRRKFGYCEGRSEAHGLKALHVPVPGEPLRCLLSVRQAFHPATGCLVGDVGQEVLQDGVALAMPLTRVEHPGHNCGMLVFDQVDDVQQSVPNLQPLLQLCESLVAEKLRHFTRRGHCLLPLSVWNG
ncbi:hypothetical protein FQZ97_850300 [compost metagenome]